jgi:hypothetical protein
VEIDAALSLNATYGAALGSSVVRLREVVRATCGAALVFKFGLVIAAGSTAATALSLNGRVIAKLGQLALPWSLIAQS